MTAEKKTPTQQGLVVSVNEKTCYVEIVTHIKHPLIGKFVKRRQKFAVHDPEGQAKVGQTIVIRSCRPRSKSKAWEFGSVVSEA